MHVMPLNITIPEYTAAITNEGIQTQELNDFFLALADALEFADPATGTGSPEGVVTAKAGKQYRDTNGTASTIMYVKNLDDIAGNQSQGWILI